MGRRLDGTEYNCKEHTTAYHSAHERRAFSPREMTTSRKTRRRAPTPDTLRAVIEQLTYWAKTKILVSLATGTIMHDLIFPVHVEGPDKRGSFALVAPEHLPAPRYSAWIHPHKAKRLEWLDHCGGLGAAPLA